ncbi:MAG: GNAT family N-acetyltransferase [Acidobacteria bacterium]|nr:GNAT family N-acetyltransferase [Acidobacteriota bacterium]
MSSLKYLPISYLDDTLLQPLMEEEESEWMSDLDWDYFPIRQILVSFIKQKLLPGYVAISESSPIGYTYFLVNQSKGIIGALYASKTSHSQEVVDELLSLTVACLKESQSIKRVEAQIMPFNDLNLTPAFIRHGFGHFARHYLELDLSNHRNKVELHSSVKIIPWDSAYLERVAEMTFLSYQDQPDAEICEDYRTQTGCIGYLRSLVENPGCGVFMPETSFIALDWQGVPCGFMICCRISDGAAIVPQIAVHPSHQGKRLGNVFMNRSFAQLKSLGFRTLSLTVTEKNRRAYDWYQRLGFRMRKQFGAYVWQR